MDGAKKTFLLVYITCPAREEAESLARELVDRHFAAGVNIFGPCASIYRWRGQIREKDEWLLLAQAAQDQFDELRAFAAERHSYETPCVIALPIAVGHPPFLAWIARSGEDECGP